MRNIIKNLLILAGLLIINSCGITQNIVWGTSHYDEKFKGFGIDKDNKAVLIGDKYDYIFTDENGLINKIITNKEIKNINFDIRDSYLTVRGKEFAKRLDLEAQTKDLSANQIEVLKSLGFKKSKPKDLDQYYFYTDIKGIRIPNGKNDYEIVFPIVGDYQKYTGIIENPGLLKTTGKILITPITVALDIVLIPIYFIGYFGMAIGSN